MSHLKSVIEPHLGECVAIFVANTQPCLDMSHAPPASGGRRTVRTTFDDLEDLELPASFAFAVILCPGDSTELLAQYAITHDIPADRFHFYHTFSTNAVTALIPFREAGLEPYSVHEITGWGQLNKHFGAAWNNLIHDQFCRKLGCHYR